jgi:RimJ/RimL family protein N-acetyltransferase
MAAPTCLETPRLRLRKWRDADRVPFALMNADPIVMEYYPAVLTAAESDAFVDQIEQTFASEHVGLWAVEAPGVSPFIGYVGLWPVRFAAAFAPAVEVGCRLAKEYWGRGYAVEAAQAALTDGFDRLGFSEIVSFTSVINHRSRRVMEKLGMTHDPQDDFDHPNLPKGHPLRAHVLYRINPTQLAERP